MRSLYNILRFIFSHPLSSKHKTEAIKRFLRYQLAKLFNPYPILYPFTDKTVLVIEKGMAGATGNIYCGLHEFEDMAFLLHFLRADDLFVDVGANVGSYSVLASGHVGSKSIAIEPVTSTFGRLQNNIAINNLSALLTSYNLGIGSKAGVLNFTSDLDTVNHVALDSTSANVVEVRVETLDHLLSGLHPLLLKIDVEGFESEVLRGAHGVLNDEHLKAIIIELNGSGRSYGFSDEDIHQNLLDFHFHPFTYEPYSRTLSPRESFGQTNTIYIRDFSYVKFRVKNSMPFNVLGHLI